MPPSVPAYNKDARVAIGHDSYDDSSDKAIADCQQALYSALAIKGHGSDVTDQDVATLAKNCSKLTEPASNAVTLEQLTTLTKASEAHMTAEIKASEARMTAETKASEARMTAETKASEARMMAEIKASEARTKAEIKAATAIMGYNTMARTSNAASPANAPLMKLKGEAGNNAGALPTSPPFPATSAAVFSSIEEADISALETFYGVKFTAAAAEVQRNLRSSSSINNDLLLQQRRQQLAAFIGVRH